MLVVRKSKQSQLLSPKPEEVTDPSIPLSIKPSASNPDSDIMTTKDRVVLLLKRVTDCTKLSEADVSGCFGISVKVLEQWKNGLVEPTAQQEVKINRLTFLCDQVELIITQMRNL